MEDLTNIGVDYAKLKAARERTGKSQSEVARIVGVCRQMISHVETGRKLPSADVLTRLCRLYGISLAELETREAVAA